MKTILTHLQSLPEPYRSQAIENANNPKCNMAIPALQRKSKSLSDSLSSAFLWHLSPQGDEYWKNLYESL